MPQAAPDSGRLFPSLTPVLPAPPPPAPPAFGRAVCDGPPPAINIPSQGEGCDRSTIASSIETTTSMVPYRTLRFCRAEVHQCRNVSSEGTQSNIQFASRVPGASPESFQCLCK